MIPSQSSMFGGMQAMQQNMQDKFTTADIDKSGSLSKTEASDAIAGTGLDESKFNKMFDKMDADGNGEVSQQEQEDMMAQMQERMEKFKSMGGGMGAMQGSSYGATDTLTSLLESLSNEEDDSADDDEFQSLLEDIKTNGYNQQNLQQSANLLNSKAPSVNTYA